MLNDRRRATLRGLGLLALPTFLLAAGLSAQDTDSGWQPFLGCWEPEDQDTENEGALCFVPNAGQVDMLTIADGEVTFSEYFAADGTTRTIDQDGCRGTESARFSDDRERIYTYSDLTCDDGARRSSGIISMATPNAWLDVRSLEGEDGPQAWVQGYRRVNSEILTELGFANPNQGGLTTFRTTSRGTFARLDLDDVIDASNAVDEQAVEAWLAESGQGIDRLDADDLIALEDAGVSEDVIDIVVAASFPQRFVLNRDGGEPQGTYGRRVGARPIYLGGYGRYYDPFYSGFGYSSFYGYGYGGYGVPYYGGGYYRPVRVYVGQSNARSGGRAVNGQGYRRGGRSSTGTARPAGDRGSVSGSSGATRSSPPASSSGGSRKARRRRGGR